MFFYILTLLISVPLIELIILIKVNEFIGIQWTLIIIILTGISGSYLLKRQGIKIVSKIRSETSTGRIPGDKIIEGLLLFAGGIAGFLAMAFRYGGDKIVAWKWGESIFILIFAITSVYVAFLVRNRLIVAARALGIMEDE